MGFASFPYLLFLGFTLTIYFLLPRRARVYFLLLASLAFYATYGVGFVVLMIFTTSVTYVSARLCRSAAGRGAGLAYILGGILIDLAVFILFKYFHLIDPTIMNWPGWSMQQLLIPLGISFYTFKTLGYCIDILKKKYPPEKSFVHYAASVAFFPQLIAGPLEKSHTLILQLKKENSFNRDNFIEGGKLIFWGFFKKLVIADSIAGVINPVFGNLGAYGGLDYLVALFFFIYQVYADFSGYSDIAIGSARCFGVELPPNFDKPFFAKNVLDFWSRWHASFSAWLKEYIFNSLGGISRSSTARTVLNLAIVFLIVGLWHGATTNYLLYASFAFLFMVADIGTRNYRKRNNSTLWARLTRYVFITGMISVLSVFFRPAHFDDSWAILHGIFTNPSITLQPLILIYLTGLVLLLELLQFFQINPTGHCFEKINNYYVRGALYAAMLFAVILLSSRPDVTFQYFQF